MSFKTMQNYHWHPTALGGETLQQQEMRIGNEWIRKNLSPQAQREWLRNAVYRRAALRREEALRSICDHDSAELVELLYPRDPTLFQKARPYTLSSTLFTNLYEGPFTEEVLLQCVHARTAQLDAACLFALTGAVRCLEKLLEYGVDPDGLETPDSWSYLELPNGQILPVSPMDCALLGDHEDCQLLLEMFGGTTLHEHLTEQRKEDAR